MHIPFYGASDDIMGILSIIIMVIQLAFLFGTIFQTEKTLKTISMRMEQGNKGLLPEQGYRQPQVLLSTLFIHYQESAHSVQSDVVCYFFVSSVSVLIEKFRLYVI